MNLGKFHTGEWDVLKSFNERLLLGGETDDCGVDLTLGNLARFIFPSSFFPPYDIIIAEINRPWGEIESIDVPLGEIVEIDMPWAEIEEIDIPYGEIEEIERPWGEIEEKN